MLSEPAKQRPNARVLAALDAHLGELATCAVVWNEIRFGVVSLAPSKKRDQMEAYLENVSARLAILPYDERAADWHAEECARLKHRGYTPPYADGQIAAIARVNGLTVVTANTRDFRRFRNLKLENWTR